MDKLDLIIQNLEKIGTEQQRHGDLIHQLITNVGALSKTVNTLDQKVSSLDQTVNTLDQKVSSLDQTVSTLDQKVGSLDQKVGSLDQKVGSLDQKVEAFGEKLTVVADELHIFRRETKRNFRNMESHMKLADNDLDEAIERIEKLESRKQKIGNI